MPDQTITAVCGLGRCGSTLMMRMLHAGGMDVFCENKTDFENGLIFGLPDDNAWLADCRGKALKLLDPHKNQPCPRYDYRFIWMDRDPKQQAMSQIKLLKHAGFSCGRNEMRAFRKSNITERPQGLATVRKFGPVLIVRFEDLLDDPLTQSMRVKEFTGQGLNVGKMISQVIARSPECYPGMLEDNLI